MTTKTTNAVNEAARSLACSALENWAAEGRDPAFITPEYVRQVAEGLLADVARELGLPRTARLDAALLTEAVRSATA